MQLLVKGAVRQSEMAAETGNTYISETVTDCNENRWQIWRLRPWRVLQ